MTAREKAGLGWDECDVIIVTGDAYVDHPAFGAAVIGRVLVAAGYRVGVIARPRWDGEADFRRLGRPRLFFGVTGGNVDSLVANRSPSGQRRRTDDYAAGGRPGGRPDRAVTVYCNRLRESFPGVPLVIGGIEASLRRLAHYDYWSDSVRGSVLLDTRASVLVYGMGERQVVEVAGRIERGEALDGIAGTCVVSRETPQGAAELPAFERAQDDAGEFSRGFRAWYATSGDPAAGPVAKRHGGRYVIQNPVPEPMAQAELDRVYGLPYARAVHPSYQEPVPALETVRYSIASHRGCLGSCSFCSLRAHQGRLIQWRSAASIVEEARRIARMPGFRGHITDVGGPTANMYAATCSSARQGRPCPDRECTFPAVCPRLEVGLDRHRRVLDAVRRIPGVQRVTVGSGLRYDLIRGEEGEAYLDALCRHHVSGQLRIAPEHVSKRVLRVMRKAGPGSYQSFRARFARANRRLGKKQYLIPYFISGHPGATVEDAVELAEHLVLVERVRVRQVQQFTPLPMTVAGAAYHIGRDPLTGEELHVARTANERRLQRVLLQLWDERNYRFAIAELEAMGRKDLARRVRALRSHLPKTKSRAMRRCGRTSVA